MNMDTRDRFWDQNLENERLKIKKNREEAEAALQDSIRGEKFEEFKKRMDEPAVVMMIHDLEELLKSERQRAGKESGGQSKYIMSCTNKWRVRWSYLIIVVAMYSVAFIPMRIAVHPHVLDPVYTPLDFFTFALYVADVFVNLCTTFLDPFGQEMWDHKTIMKRYIRSPGFWIDVLSLLNYPMSTAWYLNMIGILKVNRVLRISTLVSQSNLDKGSKIMMMMLYYYMLFIIYLHLVGCMWFFFIEQTYLESKENSRYQPWVPPYDYYDSGDPFWDRYENDDRMFIYWVCLYYSVLVIGGNEMGPKELKELVFMVMINLTGAIFQAYIFGELAVLIAQVGTKAKNKQ